MKIATLAVLILAFAASAAQSSDLSDAQALCKETWTKRGVLDQGMFDFCVSESMKAAENIKYLDSRYLGSAWYSRISQPYCAAHGSKHGLKDHRLIELCLNQEVDGILDLQYESKQKTWIEKFATYCLKTQTEGFQMAAFCYKQHEPDDVEGLKKNPVTPDDIAVLREILKSEMGDKK